MTRLSPFAVLLLFGFVGIVTHRIGLWLPFGIVAIMVVAGMQKKRALAGVADEHESGSTSHTDLVRTGQATDDRRGCVDAEEQPTEIERRTRDL
jgi:hypothetical protein